MSATLTGRPHPVQPVRRPGPGPVWPLTAVCVGLPLWWILGLASLILPLAAAVMVWQLLPRRRQLQAPRGFGLWLLFLAMVAISVLVLWADAPGAVPGGGLGRLASWLVTATFFAAATVAMIWVGNHSEQEVATRAVLRAVGWLFVVSVAGGWLGLLAPHVELTSAAQLLLPHGIRNATFVTDLVRPVTAQVQDVLGYAEARPAAPYPYTNAWGANTALYLPFFVLGWLTPDAGRGRRVVGFVVLAAAVVPVIDSLNRGMWLGILLMAVLAAARLTSLGRYGALLALVAGTAVAALALVATPLGTTIVERVQHPHSNARRADLASSTLQYALSSPVVGYGSTRPVQGNFASVAGGATADCPQCSVPPFGTHGQFYRIAYTEGLPALALFLGFLGYRLLRQAGSRDPVVIAVSLMTVTAVFFTFFYNLLPHALFVVMLGLGLAWRRLEAGGRRSAGLGAAPAAEVGRADRSGTGS